MNDGMEHRLNILFIWKEKGQGAARNNHGERAATFCHGQGEDIGSFWVGEQCDQNCALES